MDAPPPADRPPDGATPADEASPQSDGPDASVTTNLNSRVVEDELRLAGAGRLEHGFTRTFEVVRHGRAQEAFVLGYDGAHYAYLNECPHWCVELDLGDGHFYDEELDRIYCKNHGALFSPVTGECETGPCLGRSLVPLRVRREGDDVLVRP